MSTTYGYAYARPDGKVKRVGGFTSRREAATYLGHSLHDNGYLPKAEAQWLARAALRADGAVQVAGWLAKITTTEEEA